VCYCGEHYLGGDAHRLRRGRGARHIFSPRFCHRVGRRFSRQLSGDQPFEPDARAAGPLQQELRIRSAVPAALKLGNVLLARASQGRELGLIEPECFPQVPEAFADHVKDS
jgi:hypothetical protein